MLARQFRITKKEEFEAIYRQGKGFSSGMMVAIVRNNSLHSTRFGVVASTKFSKHAVERNRIKRQMREIIRKRKKNIVSGKDIVISVRKINSKTSYSSCEVENALMEVFNKAKLINKKKI